MLREARDCFLAENGFIVEGYGAPTYRDKLWKLPIRFPNTKVHPGATPLHDLRHILTGYRTNWIGEAEIAAWELRRMQDPGGLLARFVRSGHRIVTLAGSSWACLPRGAWGPHTL